jgi:hypothetical protein
MFLRSEDSNSTSQDELTTTSYVSAKHGKDTKDTRLSSPQEAQRGKKKKKKEKKTLGPTMTQSQMTPLLQSKDRNYVKTISDDQSKHAKTP